MKKIISIVMAVILLSSLIYPCKSFISEKVQLNNVLSVSHDVANMCAEYDDYDSLAQDDDKTIYKD